MNRLLPIYSHPYLYFLILFLPFTVIYIYPWFGSFHPVSLFFLHIDRIILHLLSFFLSLLLLSFHCLWLWFSVFVFGKNNFMLFSIRLPLYYSIKYLSNPLFLVKIWSLTIFSYISKTIFTSTIPISPFFPLLSPHFSHFFFNWEFHIYTVFILTYYSINYFNNIML